MTQEELTDRLNIASIKYYRGEETEFSDIEFHLNFSYYIVFIKINSNLWLKNTKN